VLRNAAAVARGEALAVTINASQFKPRIPSLYLRGDLATTGECVVSESKANQFGAHTYLLWFADDLTPHLETTKPVPARAIKQARWGVGGGYWLVKSREPNNFLHDAGRDSVDRRTALGIDSRRKTLWLAVFQRASHYLAAHTLAHEGASDALMVDGGTSSTMVIGDGAREMESGTVFGGSRPQAIHLGIRARRRED
jgi:exopolysaccharide biosynthesis protein